MLFVFVCQKQMSRKKLIAGISLLALTGIAIYLLRRHKKNVINELKAEQVAEHGYETAHDILFPQKTRRIKKSRPTDL